MAGDPQQRSQGEFSMTGFMENFASEIEYIFLLLDNVYVCKWLDGSTTMISAIPIKNRFADIWIPEVLMF